MRKTLEKYVGQFVIIRGKYVGYPKGHKRTGRVYDESIGDAIHPNDNEIKIEYEKLREGTVTSPVEFFKIASCIKNVVGIGKFQDIDEDHINLMQDINELCPQIVKNDIVEIRGYVGAYNKNGQVEYNICAKRVMKVASYDDRFISYIIPACNAEQYIKRCIDSITNNISNYSYEILVIENGSKDNTSRIVDEIKSKDGSVKLLHSSKGVSNARNMGIENANGKWLFFVDADDTLIKTKKNSIEEFARSDESDLIVFGHKSGDRIIYKSEKYYELYKDEQIENIIIKMLKNPTVYLTVWGKLLRRDIVLENGIRFDKELSFAEDSHFVLQYLKCIKSACLVRDIVYNYSIDKPSAMRGNATDKKAKYVKSLKKSKMIFDKDNNQLKHAYSFYVIMHFNIIMVRTCFSVYYRQSLSKRISEMKDLCKNRIISCALNDIKITECNRISMLPCLFVKMRCWLLAALMFRVRAVQNYRRER